MLSRIHSAILWPLAFALVGVAFLLPLWLSDWWALSIGGLICIVVGVAVSSWVWGGK